MKQLERSSMPYAFTQDVPIDSAFYARITEGLGDEPPPGLLVHLAVERPEGGLRYVSIWESEEDCDRFGEERLHPVVHALFPEVFGDQLPAGTGANPDIGHRCNGVPAGADPSRVRPREAATDRTARPTFSHPQSDGRHTTASTRFRAGGRGRVALGYSALLSDAAVSASSSSMSAVAVGSNRWGSWGALSSRYSQPSARARVAIGSMGSAPTSSSPPVQRMNARRTRAEALARWIGSVNVATG